MSLRDGGSTESPLIGRYCGVVLPPSHLSRGNQLLIRFKTDHSVGHDGFRASYKTGKDAQWAKKWNFFFQQFMSYRLYFLDYLFETKMHFFRFFKTHCINYQEIIFSAVKFFRLHPTIQL